MSECVRVSACVARERRSECVYVRVRIAECIPLVLSQVAYVAWHVRTAAHFQVLLRREIHSPLHHQSDRIRGRTRGDEIERKGGTM